MKFSPDTSRLVEGRAYWCVDPNFLTGEPYRTHYDGAGVGWLWGDECPPPTVEVEPERPPAALLPCPFCGSADVAPNGTEDQPLWNQWVRCASCEAEGPTRTGGHAVVAAAWNTRAAPPAPLDAVQRERDRCLAVARGCFDMMGGYNDTFLPVFHHGIQTVVNALSDDPKAYASMVLERIGAAPHAPEPAPAEPERPAWVPPVCPAGQVLISDGVPVMARRDFDFNEDTDWRYPPPAWPPRIGEIVEVSMGNEWVPVMVTSGPWWDRDWRVQSAFRAINKRDEGRGWRWVYRDLSGYVPPGGGQ
jgi:Lar family restriction alleviation protein